MVILGHEISKKAEKFINEKEKLLGKIIFKDINKHLNPSVRELDGCHDLQGSDHVVWLKPGNPDFESFMMHEIMHGVLIHEGFPKTARASEFNDEQSHYIGSLLTSVIADPIIDNQLIELRLATFNRGSAIQNKITEALLDSKICKGSPYGFCFCKWALISFHACIDNSFTEKQRKDLYSVIDNKFPQATEFGKLLCGKIKKEGYSVPQKALNAMLVLRNSLKLNERVIIVDSQGRSH